MEIDFFRREGKERTKLLLLAVERNRRRVWNNSYLRKEKSKTEEKF